MATTNSRTTCTACQNPEAEHVVGDSEIYCDPCAASLCRLALDIESELEASRLEHLSELATLMQRARSFTGLPGHTTINGQRVAL